MKKSALIVIFTFLAFQSIGQSVDSLMNLIYYHYDRNQFVEVVSVSREAIAFFEKSDDLFNMAGCYNVMGVAYQRLGQFDEAIDCYNRCCDAMEELRLSDPDNVYYARNIRYTKNNIAAIYSSLGEYEQSLALYRSCMESLGQPHDTADFLDMATYLQNIADVIVEQESRSDSKDITLLNEAVAMAEQAYDYSQRYGDLPYKQLHSMLTLSQTYFAVGRTDEAIELANRGLGMTESGEDLYPRAECLMLLGSFHAGQQNYKQAETYYAEAVALARQGHYLEVEHNALEGAYNAARHFNPELALGYLESSVLLNDSIYSERQQHLLREYQVRYELSEKDHELEIQKERNTRNWWFGIVSTIAAILLAVLLVIWIRLNRANRTQRETLKNLNDAKDKLLSVSSHDIKTSVIAQNMVLDQLYQHCGSMKEAELKENILALKTSSDALKDKLNNILQWVMCELGSRDSHPVNFDLGQLVNSCLLSLVAELENKNIKVNNLVSPEIQCHDDRNLIGLVLQNLLSNAVKFSNPNGEITLKAEENEQQVWFTVADNGVGIAPERLETLTNGIVESTQGTAGETGTGLGLLVCRQLLERNNGTIHIESTPGKGTTVRFSINK